MGNISNTIKKIAVDAQEAGKPVLFFEAEVLQATPLRIRIKNDKKLELTGSVLRVAEHLLTHTRVLKIDDELKQVEFQGKLSVGDRVMIASVQGGQSVFVIDKF